MNKYKKGDIVSTVFCADALVLGTKQIAGEELLKVQCLNWTREYIEQMGGIEEAWVIISSKQVVRIKSRHDSININSFIKVKLTEYGKEIYIRKQEEEYREYGILATPRPIAEDECGFSSFQLWKFMSIFGQYMGVGCEKVIDPLEIYKEDLVWKAEMKLSSEEN